MRKLFFLNVLLVLWGSLIATGCKKNPTDKLVNSINNGVVPNSSGIFLIFKNELYTGGGISFVPGGENQSLSVQDQSSPQLDHWQLRYSWNGGDVTNFDVVPPVPEHAFAGFVLPITVSVTQLTGVQGKNLSGPNYKTLKFFARGSLSEETTLRVEGPTDGINPTPDRTEFTSSDLTSDWKSFCLNISPAQFSNVKIFMTATFQYAQTPRTTVPGNGGVVYMDDIRYEGGGLPMNSLTGIARIFICFILFNSVVLSGRAADTSPAYPFDVVPSSDQKSDVAKKALGRVFGVAGSGGEISYFVVDLYEHNRVNATVRSTLLPGWGQIYNGEPMKGTLLMGSMIVTTALTVSLINKSNNSYNDYKNLGVKDSSTYDDYVHARTQAMILGTVSVGIWLFSIFDAKNNAYKTNWAYQPPPLEIAAYHDGAGVRWNKKF